MDETIAKLQEVNKLYTDNKELYNEEDINLRDLIDTVLFEKSLIERYDYLNNNLEDNDIFKDLESEEDDEETTN